MPEVKISALPAAGTLDGTEKFPIVQGGVTKAGTTGTFVRATGDETITGLKTVRPAATTAPAFVIKRLAGQTAYVFEMRDENDVVRSRITPEGDIELGPLVGATTNPSRYFTWDGGGGNQNNPPWRMYTRDSATDPNDQTLITTWNLKTGPVTQDDATRPSVRWGLEPQWFNTLEWNLDVYDPGGLASGKRLFQMHHIWQSSPKTTVFEWWGSTVIHPSHDGIGLVVRGNSGVAQTQPYFQIQNSAQTAVFSVVTGDTGEVHLGDPASPARFRRDSADVLRVLSSLMVDSTLTLKSGVTLSAGTTHSFQRSIETGLVQICGGTSASVGSAMQVFGPSHASNPSIGRFLTSGNVVASFGPSGLVMGITYPLVTNASAAGITGFRIPHGAAPTSPVDGDIWTTTAGMFVRINGVTKTVTLT